LGKKGSAATMKNTLKPGIDQYILTEAVPV
jgi:hypothetical protein